MWTKLKKKLLSLFFLNSDRHFFCPEHKHFIFPSMKPFTTSNNPLLPLTPFLLHVYNSQLCFCILSNCRTLSTPIPKSVKTSDSKSSLNGRQFRRVVPVTADICNVLGKTLTHGRDIVFCFFFTDPMSLAALWVPRLEALQSDTSFPFQ